MNPIKFKEANVTFAEHQPEYIPLPAYKSEGGLVVSCWKLSWTERVKLMITGMVWVHMLTFNKPLQPHRLDVRRPFAG